MCRPEQEAVSNSLLDLSIDSATWRFLQICIDSSVSDVDEVLVEYRIGWGYEVLREAPGSGLGGVDRNSPFRTELWGHMIARVESFGRGNEPYTGLVE